MLDDYQVAFLNPIHSDTSLATNLLSDKDFCDVTLVGSDNRQVHAHRAILCACSSLLRNLLQDSLQQSTYLFLGQVHYEELQALLQYIYLGHCSVQSYRVETLQSLATQLGVEGLQIGNEHGEGKNSLVEEDLDGKNVFSQEAIVRETNVENIMESFEMNEYGEWNTIDLEEYLGDKNDFREKVIEDIGLNFDTSIESIGKGVISYVDIDIEDEKEFTYNVTDNDTNVASDHLETVMESLETNEKNQHFTKTPHITNTQPNADDKLECNSVVKYSKTINNRKQKKHEGFTYNCDICNTQYNHRASLRDHKRLIHERVVFSCEACKKIFKSEHSLGRHKGHEEKCSQCEYIACTIMQLRKHSNTIHNDTFSDGTFKCTICVYTNVKAFKVKNHMRYNHGHIRLSCDQCPFQTKRRHALKMHKDNKHLGIKYPCEQCDFQAIKRRLLKYHVLSKHENVKYECEECKQYFNSIDWLRIHKQSKHSSVKYQCKQCDFTCDWRSSLKRHIQQVHENKKYKCNLCNYDSKAQYCLKVHILTKHKREFKFQCDYCLYQTGLNSVLRIHIQVMHEGTSTFECKDCGKQVGSKYELSRHIKIHGCDSKDCCKKKT